MNKHKRRRAQLTDARSKSRGVAFFGRAVCLLIDQGTKGTPLRGPLLFFSVRMHRYACAHAGGAYALVCIHPCRRGALLSPSLYACVARPSFSFCHPSGRTCPPTFRTRSPRSLIRSGSHPRAAAIPSGRLHHVPALWGRLAWPLTRHSHLHALRLRECRPRPGSTREVPPSAKVCATRSRTRVCQLRWPRLLLPR